MHAFMYLFGILSLIGGLFFGASLLGDSFTRASGIALMLGGFVSAMLFFAVGKILDRLDEIQTVIGRPSK